MTATKLTKTAESHLDDPAASYDAYTAPVAVVEPGQGKHAEHVDLHRADEPGSHAAHIGHTIPPARGQHHAPEGPKKGGHAGWGTIDPKEVLEDQTGAGKVEKQPSFLAPESKAEEQQALKEAFVPGKEDEKVMTLEEFEHKKH